MIELIAVLAVTAVLVVTAGSGLERLLQANRRAITTNTLHEALIEARYVAVTKHRLVGFCAGNRATGCHGDWTDGEWIVFFDDDRDGAADSVESIVATGHARGVQIAGNGPFRSEVIYTPLGVAQRRSGAFAAGRLRVCVAEAINPNANDLVLAASGHIRLEPHDFNGRCPSP